MDAVCRRQAEAQQSTLTERVNTNLSDINLIAARLRREGVERPRLARFLDAWAAPGEHRSAFVGSEARGLETAGALTPDYAVEDGFLH